MGRYCSYLLPNQGGGTFQIQVNLTQVLEDMGRPVQEWDECSIFSLFHHGNFELTI